MAELLIAKDGFNIDDNEFQFDSRRKHLLVDLDAKPKHFDTVDITGTNISATGTTTYETLLTIAHGLNYKPKVETYIFDSGTWNLYSGSGSYYRGYYPYIPGSGVDIIYGEADATNYYIKHSITSLGPPLTSTAASFPLKIKYYIFSDKGTY